MFRTVLFKPSLFTDVAGLSLLGICLIGRPLTLETSRLFATGSDPDHE